MTTQRRVVSPTGGRMNRILTHTVLSAAFAATFAIAQTPQNPDQVTPVPEAPRSTAQQAATEDKAVSGTYRGIVMDASCDAIQNSGSGRSANESSRSRSAAPEQNSKAATSASVEGPTATTSGTTVSPSVTASTGVNPDQAGQATTNIAVTPPADQLSTVTSAHPSADGNSSVTTYSGAAAPSATGTPKDGKVPSTSRTISIADEKATDSEERNRSSSPSISSLELTTVREKYKDCRVTSTTSSFALMSNGQLYMIDDSKGLLQRMVNAADLAAEWHTVTIAGNVDGDRLTPSSMQ